jgi:hypothetical protein
MITPKGFVNCLELDELEQWVDEMEDKAYDDNDDDDSDIRERYYPETLP